jgi:tetratricopeptide (TPR) repeat protein
MLTIKNRVGQTTIDKFKESIRAHFSFYGWARVGGCFGLTRGGSDSCGKGVVGEKIPTSNIQHPLPPLAPVFRTLMVGLLILLAISLAGCTPKGARALLQGKKLVDKGRYAEAIERLTNAASILGTNAQAWNYLGLAYHYAGHAGEAETAYNRALRLDHDLSEAHYNLGCLRLEENKPDLARTELTAFTLRRGNSVEGFLKLGEAQLAGHDAAAIPGAEKSFQEALRLNSQNPEALNGLGMVRTQQKRYGDAQQFFLNALRQRPDFAPAILNLAVLHHTRLQDHPAALQRYRQYVALKPRPANAEVVLAVAQQLEQELRPNPAPAPPVVAPGPAPGTKSRADSRTNPPPHATTNVAITPVSVPDAAKVTPKAESIPVRPANTTTQAGASPVVAKQSIEAPTNSHFASAQPAKNASGNRKEAEKLFNQGSDAQKAHRLQDAITAYRTATQLDPGYFDAHYNLGLAAAEAGNTQLALSAYENALAILPDSLDARYNFGLLLKQAGYVSDALDEWEKLVASHPNNAKGQLALANLYAQQLHDNAQAREHYLKVLEVDPHNGQADEIRHWITEHPQ